MNGLCRQGRKHGSKQGAWQKKIDSPPLSLPGFFFSCSRLCVFADRGSEGLSLRLSMEVTSSITSALIFSLAATVFLCLDDGLNFLLDCDCELEVFSQA